MYNGAVTRGITIGRDGYQRNYSRYSTRAASSPYLFILLMDEPTRHMKDKVPWWMLSPELF